MKQVENFTNYESSGDVEYSSHIERNLTYIQLSMVLWLRTDEPCKLMGVRLDKIINNIIVMLLNIYRFLKKCNVKCQK